MYTVVKNDFINESRLERDALDFRLRSARFSFWCELRTFAEATLSADRAVTTMEVSADTHRHRCATKPADVSVVTQKGDDRCCGTPDYTIYSVGLRVL